MPNDISQSTKLFFDAYDATASAGAGKPVWVTETGWLVNPSPRLQVVSYILLYTAMIPRLRYHSCLLMKRGIHSV
jgi:hypothetical protein